jgi:hypothetical protein
MSFYGIKRTSGYPPSILKMYFYGIKKTGEYPLSILKISFFEIQRLVDTHQAF